MLSKQLLVRQQLELVRMLEGASGWRVHRWPERGGALHQLSYGKAETQRPLLPWGEHELMGDLRSSEAGAGSMQKRLLPDSATCTLLVCSH